VSQGSPVQGPTTYPTTVDLDAAPVRRWSPFVNWLLAIPHYFVLIALVIVWWFVMIISLFTVLFTKNIPDGLFRFAVMVLRYQWRVGSYVLFLRSAYPKFEFPSDPQDPGDDPAKLSVQTPAEYNRFLPLVKWLLAIPHFIILYFLGIAAAVVAFINIFVVLFTGAWSEGMRTFVVGYYRWQYRAYSYAYLLVDEYPPFSLE
jgi:ABC-type multidrug transport system fused ATPase/permease subunit